ncbi:MAG: signal peptidase II [Pseudomonadota bacterium]
MKKRLILILVCALLTLAADQATKIWARHSLKNQPPVSLVDGYLDLEYHENPGFAFGMGRNLPWRRAIYVGLAIIALFVMWRIIRNVQKRQRMADVAFGLLAGGAIGNAVDRIYIGRVVDFILAHWHRKVHWPTFNIADAALVVGVGFLLIVLGHNPDTKRSNPAKNSKSKKGRKYR